MTPSKNRQIQSDNIEMRNPVRRSKPNPTKVIAFAILALGLLAVLLWQGPAIIFPSHAPEKTDLVSPTTFISPTPNHANQSEMVEYALSLINSDRQTAGLQNVTLSSISSGQSHAESMLDQKYFSHWDTNGYKPYMRYTLAGGKGAVSENLAWNGETGNILSIDVKSALKNMEYEMMYNDSSSNWGHRDNILNPLHDKVSIGVAYDRNNVYFVQDFENDYINWTTLSSVNNQITLIGTIQKDGLTIQNVGIFYDKPAPLSVNQLANASYQGGYDPGTYVGMALPPKWQASGGITIVADIWIQNGNTFQISFALSQAIVAHGKGVYTLYLETGSSTANSLTTYSLWV
jgi:uncharacterized protein YkwD